MDAGEEFGRERAPLKEMMTLVQRAGLGFTHAGCQVNMQEWLGAVCSDVCNRQ